MEFEYWSPRGAADRRSTELSIKMNMGNEGTQEATTAF